MKRLIWTAAIVLALLLSAACSKSSDQAAKAEDEGEYKVGQVQMNPHPASLEGKTVVLRWNGKYNGDKLLDRVAELLIDHVQNVKIVKLWVEDPSTATTSENGENSEKFAESALSYKPDLVIASSAD